MKKFIIIMLLFVPFSVFAQAGGTCSWHGGVDCNAGSDWDGSAVCNDGWRDSSEVYYSVLQCKEIKHNYCTSEEYNTIKNNYKLDEQEKNIADLSAQFSTFNSSNIRQNAIDALNLQSKILPLQAKYKSDFDRALLDCYILGDKAYEQRRQDEYKRIDDLNKERAEQLETLYKQLETKVVTQPLTPPKSTDNLCVERGIANSHQISSTQCGCDAGYSNYNNQCVDALEYCSLTLGAHGIVTNQTSCGCAKGYVFNSNNTSCIEEPVAVITPKASAVETKKKSEATNQTAKVLKSLEVKDTVSTTADYSISTAQVTTSSSTNQKVIPTKQSSIRKITLWFRNLFK